MDELDIIVVQRASADDLERIERGLASHAAGKVEARHYLPVSVLVRQSDGEVVGGLRGATVWSWLQIKHLWVREDLRNGGLGSRLVEAAEEEAIKRGCRSAWVDTFSFQAVEFYHRLGYEEFANLGDFPAGESRVFLKKVQLQP